MLSKNYANEVKKKFYQLIDLFPPPPSIIQDIYVTVM